jgi:hypothetical protein
VCAAEAYRIHLAYFFDPLLAVHTSQIEPLPHQLTAVYDKMLKRQPLRLLLVDDPGAGKTTMAGLLIKELMVRDDVQRCLICAPGALTDQWQDERWNKFHLRSEILTRDKLEASYSGNPFQDEDRLIIRNAIGDCCGATRTQSTTGAPAFSPSQKSTVLVSLSAWAIRKILAQVAHTTVGARHFWSCETSSTCPTV